MTRYTLKKHERLKSKILLDLLFKEGQSHFTYPFKLLYQVRPLPENQTWPLLFSVSVPKKKIRLAVNRNLIKRRVREAYRLNKTKLQEQLLKEKNLQLSLMFIYIEGKPRPYADIEKSVIKLLAHLENSLSQ